MGRIDEKQVRRAEISSTFWCGMATRKLNDNMRARTNAHLWSRINFKSPGLQGDFDEELEQLLIFPCVSAKGKVVALVTELCFSAQCFLALQPGLPVFSSWSSKHLNYTVHWKGSHDGSGLFHLGFENDTCTCIFVTWSLVGESKQNVLPRFFSTIFRVYLDT